MLTFDDKFDVITSTHVIEHLYKLEQMLLKIHESLKPDELLIFATPNLNSIAIIIHGDNWQGYRYDHVSNDREKFIESYEFVSTYNGTPFFSGLKIFKIFQFSLVTGFLSVVFSSAKWKCMEIIDVFRKKHNQS